MDGYALLWKKHDAQFRKCADVKHSSVTATNLPRQCIKTKRKNFFFFFFFSGYIHNADLAAAGREKPRGRLLSVATDEMCLIPLCVPTQLPNLATEVKAH